MAKKWNDGSGFKKGPKKKTSIGDSTRTRRNHKKSTRKKSRGQGSGRR